MIKYTIYKNKVWVEIIYKGVPMSTRAVFKGKNKKECENWVKEKHYDSK